MSDLQHRGHALYGGFALGFRHLTDFQTKGNVLRDAHVGVERIALEHHGNVAILAGQVGHVAVTNQNVAAGRMVQARDHVE